MRAPRSGTTPHWVLAALVAATVTACTSQTGPAATTPNDERTPTMTAPSNLEPEPTSADAGTPIELTIGDITIGGELWDNPAGRDLTDRLPLTLTFSDYNAVEKTSRLNPALTMGGMTAGDDPHPGEIGWYAPSTDLVLYYGDVGYWNGIARLGTFDAAGITLLADGPPNVTVTITSHED